MSKLQKFLRGLKEVDEVVHALDDSGIDLDRLIGISNAQGPIAKIVHGVLLGAAQSIPSAQSREASSALQKALPPVAPQKRNKSKKKSP